MAEGTREASASANELITPNVLPRFVAHALRLLAHDDGPLDAESSGRLAQPLEPMRPFDAAGGLVFSQIEAPFLFRPTSDIDQVFDLQCTEAARALIACMNSRRAVHVVPIEKATRDKFTTWHLVTDREKHLQLLGIWVDGPKGSTQVRLRIHFAGRPR